MRPTLLYKATNTKNDKFYIGITVRPLSVRRRRHECDARAGSAMPFHRAIIKDGKDAFEWKTLAILQSQPEAAETEVRAIRILKPHYNVHPGGALGPFPPKIDVIRRIAEAHHQSVVCLNTGEFFPSVNAAKKFAKRSSLSLVLSGKEVTAGGYCFVKSDKPLNKTECRRLLKEKMDRLKSRWDNSAKSLRKRVVCISTGKFYESAALASKETGMHATSIGECCRGKITHTGGLKFVFEVDYLVGNFDPNRKKRSNGLSKRVVCLDTMIEYESVCAAAKAYKTLPANIRAVCQGKRRVAAGATFNFLNNQPPEVKTRPRAKLTVEMVREIRGLIYHVPRAQIASRYGISSQTVFDIKRRRSWKDI